MNNLGTNVGKSAATPQKCVYILAAVTAEVASGLREALGQSAGQLLCVADNAAAVNNALDTLQSAHPEQGQVHLTPREVDVMCLVAKGLRTSEIAECLGMSAHTVNTHLKHAFRKLNVANRSEAVFEATRLGLIHPHRQTAAIA